jgi:hypothetical protein
VLVLCLAPFAGAQLTEAQVVKAAKGSVKTALAQLKTDVNEARDAFLDAAEVTEAAFKEGTGNLTELATLFGVAEALQSTVQSAVSAAEQTIVDGFQAAMADMVNLDPINGEVPVQLQVGSGGVRDAAQASIDKLLDKTYAGLQKRLDKLAATVDKSSNFMLRAAIRPPGGSTAFTASGGASAVFNPGLGIDLVWTDRDITLGLSGTLRLSGTQSDVDASGGLDVTVFEADTSFHTVDDEAAVLAGSRWSATVAGLTRGSHVCQVAGHTDPQAAMQFEAFNIP